MINYGQNFLHDRPNLLRRFHGDQNLISDFIKNRPGCESFPDRGHNHIRYDRKV